MKLFKFGKTEEEKLQKEYEKLMRKSFELSKVNRAEADKAYAEAQEILTKIEKGQEN